MKKVLLIMVGIVFIIELNAQEKYKVNNYADLSLEELLNVTDNGINDQYTEEFDALLSTSVITDEQIKEAGVTNIAEAMRLIPGVIVREMTNGNFDIHLRGLDNVPPNSDFVSAANTTTALTIDGQPYYNYFQGGILWSALPIDLHDIDKIEVVRGGASSLYGPNAVSGVINIFTKKDQAKRFASFGEMIYGSDNTVINRANFSFNNGNRLSVNASGSFQSGDRSQEEYFNIVDGLTFDRDTLNTLGLSNELLPQPELATDNYTINLRTNYKWQSNRNMGLFIGYQNSSVQSTYTSETFIPLTINTSETFNLNYDLSWDDWMTRVSLQTGSQATGNTEFDLTNIDILLERNFQFNKLTFRPGVSYRTAIYEDESLESERLLEGSESLTNTAVHGWILYNVLPKNKLKILGGVRWDNFDVPDNDYFSYQLIASYQPNKQNHLRAVHSLSYRSPFLYNQFANTTTNQRIVTDSTSVNLALQTFGNESTDLMSSSLYEIGWRRKIGVKAMLDIEVFHSRNTDFTRPIRSATDTTFVNNQPLLVVPSTFQNDESLALQTGVTASFTFTGQKISLKPFITYQQTELKDYSPYGNDGTAQNLFNNSDPSVENIDLKTDVEHEGTPDIYGGFSLSYYFHNNWSINLNSYFYSEYTFYHSSNILINDGVAGIGNLSGKFLINGRLNYSPNEHIHIYGTVQNASDNDDIEYYGNDAIGRTIFFGINFNL